MGTRAYVVRQGGYLARIAYQMGFDAETVWNDAKNRALREARPNHNVLAPGDILHVPEPPEPPAALTVRPHAQNRYRARPPTVTIDIGLTNADGDASAFAGEAYVVEGLHPPREGTADGSGRVTLAIPIWIAELVLVFPRLGVAMPVRVGHLDPIDLPSGVRQRLDHLGYEAMEMEEALRAFQRARALPETGQLDEATRGALGDAHGC